jgi:hypothetical protein
VWRVGVTSQDGSFLDGGWETVAWCPAKGYAELVVESAMVRYGCLYGEIWGPSLEDADEQVAWVRYDQPADQDL